ncbi:phytoene/squalene synthase family protein [candidate division KSB1 bacterium]|nr:phytoene/squalene synthase family protein [candidate division KSB1 bacterium]
MKFWNTSANKAIFEYARLSTAHYSKSFYISTLMLPPERRWATFALYGFCRHADNLIDNPRNRSLAELLAEVNYLEEEIKIAYRTGESEHPVIRAFILVAQKFGIKMEYPLDLLKGVRMDLEIKEYENFDDLYVFCYRVAGVVGLMMTSVLGYRTEEAFQYAEKLGIAMQLTNILRDIQEDKNMGRIYIPLTELRQFGVKKQDIFNENFTDNVRNLIKFQVDRAYRYYQEANIGIPMLMRESQFAIYAASQIYRGILRKLEIRDYNPFGGRIFVPLRRKLAILLREILRTKLLSIRDYFFPNPIARMSNNL